MPAGQDVRRGNTLVHEQAEFFARRSSDPRWWRYPERRSSGWSCSRRSGWLCPWQDSSLPAALGCGESGADVVPVPAPAGACAKAAQGIRRHAPSSRDGPIRLPEKYIQLPNLIKVSSSFRDFHAWKRYVQAHIFVKLGSGPSCESAIRIATRRHSELLGSGKIPWPHVILQPPTFMAFSGFLR